MDVRAGGHGQQVLPEVGSDLRGGALSIERCREDDVALVAVDSRTGDPILRSGQPLAA